MEKTYMRVKILIILLLSLSTGFLTIGINAATLDLRGAADIEDTYAYVNLATTNYSTAAQINTGSGAATYHSFMKFDLSTLNNTHQIDAIELMIFKNLAGDYNCFFHQVTSNIVFTEATWNIYSTGNNWSTGGGDYEALVDSFTTWDVDDATDSAFCNRTTTGGFIDLVQGWVDGDYSNYGMAITTNYTAAFVQLFATEDETSGDHLKPRLTITYSDKTTGGVPARRRKIILGGQ